MHTWEKVGSYCYQEHAAAVQHLHRANELGANAASNLGVTIHVAYWFCANAAARYHSVTRLSGLTESFVSQPCGVQLELLLLEQRSKVVFSDSDLP